MNRKGNHRLFHGWRAIVIVLSLTLFWVPLVNAADHAERPDVTFLTFNVNEAPDFIYLQDGLRNMLGSRLAVKAEIQVAVGSEQADALNGFWLSGDRESFDREIWKSPSNYVIAGKLRSGNRNLIIETIVFDLRNRSQVVLPDIVTDALRLSPAVDELAWKIAEKVFGKKRPAVVVSREREAEDPAIRFQTPHPDRVFKDSKMTGPTQVKRSQGNLSVGSMLEKELDMEVKSIRVVDLDQDGVVEVVAVSDGSLSIFQIVAGGLQQVDTLDLPQRVTVYAVYCADLDSNGVQELYLSASVGDVLSSLVIEWKGKGQFVSLLTQAPYYLRPVTSGSGQKTLIGQAVGVGSGELSGALLGSPVYELSSEGKKGLSVRSRLSLPENSNVFNYVVGDIDNDGVKETIVIDDHRLKLYGEKGELLWAGEQGYGYSSNLLGVPLVDRDDPTRGEVYFVPSRIMAADLDGDGAEELVVGKNNLTSSKYLKNFRTFDGGQVAVLKWDGMEMREIWKSPLGDAYLADFDVVVQAPVDSENGKSGPMNKGKRQEGIIYAAFHQKQTGFSMLWPAGKSSEIRVFSFEAVGEGEKPVQNIKPE